MQFLKISQLKFSVLKISVLTDSQKKLELYFNKENCL